MVEKCCQCKSYEFCYSIQVLCKDMIKLENFVSLAEEYQVLIDTIYGTK